MHLISIKHREQYHPKCGACGCDIGAKYVLENGRLACNLHALLIMKWPVGSVFYKYHYDKGIIEHRRPNAQDQRAGPPAG